MPVDTRLAAFGLGSSSQRRRCARSQPRNLSTTRPYAGSKTRCRWPLTASPTGTGPTERTGSSSGAMPPFFTVPRPSCVREAIVRISDASTEIETIKRVEVYAEGQVRLAQNPAVEEAAGRALIRTAEIRLKSYAPGAISHVKDPSLAVAHHPALGPQREEARRARPCPPAGRSRPVPYRFPVRDPDETRRGSKRRRPRRRKRSAPSSPTQAVVRNQSDDVGPSLLASGEPPSPSAPASPSDGPALVTAPDLPSAASGFPSATRRAKSKPVQPKRDAMVQLASAGGTGASAAPSAAAAMGDSGTTDVQVQRARLAQQVPPTGAQPPIIDLPPIEGAPDVQVPDLTPAAQDRPPDLQPLPGADREVTVPALPDQPPTRGERQPGQEPPLVPIMPGTQRMTRITNRTGRPLDMRQISKTADGVETWLIRNGVNIVTSAPRFGTIDIEADSAIIWRGPTPPDGEPYQTPGGEFWMDDARRPMEVYLEGNVILRQDENKYAGNGDQRTIRAPRLYYDFLTDRMLAPNSEIDLSLPRLWRPSPVVAHDRTVS